MSSIAFNSPSRTVYVSGRERASMSVMCAAMLKAQIGAVKFADKDVLRAMFAADHYLQRDIAAMEAGKFGSGLQFESSFDTFISVGDGPLYADGKPYDLFSLQLNSAVSWGNRAVQLAAKLHGQCEIHAFCEGNNRAWLADIIAEGLECDVFRGEEAGYDGWTKVIDFLRSNDQEPVVTSYSVCESFPGPHCAPKEMDMGADPWEKWSQLPEKEQWDYGMAYVRAEPSLEISPDRLARRFGHTLSGRSFMARVRAGLTEKAAA